jgi:isopentenyl diphosphate isomerase/L-lactate dehydrogenase-like FMN-dependent dehydrogenase
VEPLDALLNVADFERAAEERLDPGAWGYYAGGAGDEMTLRENVAAFGRWVLRPRVLVDVSAPTTETTVLGQTVSMPLLVAPTAFQRVAHPDGELATARAAAAAGTVMMLSTLATATPAEVATAGGPRWFQLYVFRDEGVTRSLVDQARESGFGALVLTVDTPVVGRRERDFRTGFTVGHTVAALGSGGVTPLEAFSLMSAAVTWKDVEALASMSQLPVVVKGLVTAEDARLACEHGADAIVVSNHGGRQLDGVSATLEALPEVAEAVGGRIEVYLDGGVRRGADVLRALALGARAVLVGRPILWGLAAGGQDGVARVLELLRAEIELALQLLGCASPADVRREHVARRAS